MKEPPHIAAAHQHCIRHQAAILASGRCGCFYCLATFPPTAIRTWVPEHRPRGRTALCPHCGIDSVIGSASGYPITAEFLSQMQQHWFEHTTS